MSDVEPEYKGIDGVKDEKLTKERGIFANCSEQGECIKSMPAK